MIDNQQRHIFEEVTIAEPIAHEPLGIARKIAKNKTMKNKPAKNGLPALNLKLSQKSGQENPQAARATFLPVFFQVSTFSKVGVRRESGQLEHLFIHGIDGNL